MARPKYQIFISSTYKDLHEERKALTWALLSARHIPSGMENFTPSDDRGWKTILSIIDKSDYYVLILAGQYGTEDEDGLSWTEKEYNYALEKEIPILAFIREEESISAKYFDIEPTIVGKRKAFHSKVKSKHLIGFWKNKEDLVSLVTRALDNHIKDDEDAGGGRPGWYRGSEIPNQNVLNEFARLSQENSDLKNQLLKLSEANYHGLTYDELKAQMEDEIIDDHWWKQRYSSTWDFFIDNANSLAKKSIREGSQIGIYCHVFVAFGLAKVSEHNNFYELTELGIKLIYQIRKLGLYKY